jgi:hypothetical protein
VSHMHSETFWFWETMSVTTNCTSLVSTFLAGDGELLVLGWKVRPRELGGFSRYQV